MSNTTGGRVTLPIEQGMDEAVRELIARFGADAVRNSDGTQLPDLVHELATKVYSTYFVGRGDNAWAHAHPEGATRIFLMSERTPALEDGDLIIDLMTEWFAEQVAPDIECDMTRWWQVIDRTTGEVMDPATWTLHGDNSVLLHSAQRGHVYTVNFLATQIWDPTQMYNYITNGWANDPSREKERPFDVRHEATWQHVKSSLASWLDEHPEVDVVRFTTFFYHFTLVYGSNGTERFVDWFGYSASVSVAALDAFEQAKGYALTAEDFVDAGYYNSPFRPPSATFRDWIDFQHDFVTDRVRDLVAQVHDAGKEAIMFLGDNWIGVEPYGPYFERTGLDAVVGSVGSGATCRMIADIPHVKYTEGRFLPYFFPDVFNPEGDPVGEANASWLPARRAIVRSPLDRMGYGGYLSLAVQYPDFVARIEEIIGEFRSLHERTDGEKPQRASFTVGVLNAWGALRSWQTHMVAHAIYYRQTYTYLGVLEALSGLPINVEFLSFDDIRDGVPEHIGVLVNAGAGETAFAGGTAWSDAQLVAAVNSFVAHGGGFIGVGEPSAFPSHGATFQLADVLGVDKELGWSLSTRRRQAAVAPHFITQDLPGEFDEGEGTPDIVVTSASTSVLAEGRDGVKIAVNELGKGRAVYFSGLPYSHINSRLLHRAVFWAAGQSEKFDEWTADDPRVEVAYYPHSGQAFAWNNSLDDVTTTVRGHGESTWQITFAPGGSEWLAISST